MLRVHTINLYFSKSKTRTSDIRIMLLFVSRKKNTYSPLVSCVRGVCILLGLAKNNFVVVAALLAGLGFKQPLPQLPNPRQLIPSSVYNDEINPFFNDPSCDACSSAKISMLHRLMCCFCPALSR